MTSKTTAMLLFFLGLIGTTNRAHAGGSGVFVGTGELPTEQSGHTATLLPDGTVLVAGGSYGSTLANVDRYNPENGTWVAASGVHAAQGHTATLLPNGKVLVAGGLIFENGNFAHSTRAALYDPTSGTWSDTGSLTVARGEGHKSILLPNGKVLVVGGVREISTELYDIVSGTWTATGSLNTSRSGFAMALLLNGKVLVAGGFNDQSPLASSELYDPDTGNWTLTGSLGTARFNDNAGTLLSNGKVLFAGGYSGAASYLTTAELYDPTSGTWSVTGSLLGPRADYTVTLMHDGRVLIAGGSRGVNPNGGVDLVANAEVFDPVTETWSGTDNLITPRVAHTATLLPNGNVLIAGGYTDPTYLASAEIYLTIPRSPNLLNISTRMRVLTNDKVLIGGFIVTGTELKRILIRGIGPSLNGTEVLADPTLELHQGASTIATNNNWKVRSDGSTQQADIEATTIPPTHDLESAILTTLLPGAYTAILAGNDGGAGLGLVEIYDLGLGATSLLANISTRGFVDIGNNVMIGGAIIGGGSGGVNARVLVRAIGPSLPVADALGDPTLELRDGNGMLVATNDNWKVRPDGSSQQAEIEATGIPPTNDLESALLNTVNPGPYTAILAGKDDTTGVGLVEMYNLQ